MKFKTVINNIFVKNILLAAVISAVLISGTLWWLDTYTRHGDVVIVPNIKGMQLLEAIPFLQNAGLRYEVNSIHVKNAKPGSIVDLVPAVGLKVKNNRIIFITLNAASTEMLTVPDVRDLSQREAMERLKSLKFENVQVKIVPSAYESLVVGLEYNGREVNAGEKIPTDAQLTLKVSSGVEDDEENTEISDAVPSDESWF